MLDLHGYFPSLWVLCSSLSCEAAEALTAHAFASSTAIRLYVLSEAAEFTK